MFLKSSIEILWRTIRAARCRHAVARVLGKQSTALKTTGFATTTTGLVQVGGGWEQVGSFQSSRTSEHSFFFFGPAGQFRPPKQACLKTLSFLGFLRNLVTQSVENPTRLAAAHMWCKNAATSTNKSDHHARSWWCKVFILTSIDLCKTIQRARNWY
jgi:hypothetical protein